MKTLITRVISALIAAFVVGALFYYYDIQGLKFLCYVAAFLGVRELTRILFKPDDSLLIKVIFAILGVTTFALTVHFPNHATLGFVCISILFCCISIVFERRFEDLTALSLFQAKSILGFFYVGIVPAMAYRILDIPNGKIWFLTMLLIVFAGDTFAYLTGMMWGDKKILPKISPKKTIVGSIGGLAGSAVAGALSGIFFLTHVPLWGLIAVSILTGVVAQLGDLFESMLKRVANRKDSGSLMPGHGGVLDRLDGVLFGTPILLAGALLLENLF
ncbi:MAG: phosphatidate cytidylyltransferase [Pseudobdellovibrionaceae bacterium]